MDEELEKLARKINAGRQYRAMSLKPVEKTETEGKDEESYIVEGYATTYNERYVLFDFDEYRFEEQVDPHAFDKCDMSDVIMQFDHTGRVFARTSNNTLGMISDNHGLKIRADLSSTALSRSMHEDIKAGLVTKMSFGFAVRGDRIEKTQDENGKRVYIRTITDISKLYDVSAVSLPANDGTEISARSWCEGVIAELEAERLKADESEKRKKMESDERERKLALLEFELN